MCWWDVRSSCPIITRTWPDIFKIWWDNVRWSTVISSTENTYNDNGQGNGMQWGNVYFWDSKASTMHLSHIAALTVITSMLSGTGASHLSLVQFFSASTCSQNFGTSHCSRVALKRRCSWTPGTDGGCISTRCKRLRWWELRTTTMLHSSFTWK